MALKLRSVFTSTLVAVAVVACSKHESHDISTPSHEVDQPTRGTHAWMWSDVSDASYHDVITPLVGLNNSLYIDKNHDLTVWAQSWIDRIDSRIRSEHPEKMANTPRPFAKVIKNGSANAFVAPVPVCFDIRVKLKNGNANALNTLDAVYFDPKDGIFASWPMQYDCVSGVDHIDEIKGFVEVFNNASDSCKLEVNGNTLAGNAQCLEGSDVVGAVAARKVVFFQTANYVTLHTGIFPLMTEEALVGVIAHELGHYYRAHVAHTAAEFDFFYTMGETNTDKRPVAEPAKKEMGDLAVAASTLLTNSDSFTTFDNQTIRPELFMAVGSMIAAVAAEEGSADTCAEAASLLKNSEFVAAMGTYPFADASVSMTSSYKKFETNANACLKELKLGEGNELTADAVSYRKFVSLINTPTWPSWLREISAGGRSFVARMNALTVQRAGQTAPAGQGLNVADVVLAVSNKLNEQDHVGYSALKAAHEARLGQYTSEQEADDIAAEWLNDIGIEAHHMVEAMRTLGKGTSNGLRGFILGEQDCEALWKRQWTNADGTYAFVPVGDYSEVHHSTCFRMFNLDREISAHNYQVPSDAQAPLLDAAGWKALQRKAANLVAFENVANESTESSDQPAVAGFIKKALKSCPYAHSYH